MIKEKTKTIIAFIVLAALLAAGFILTDLDHRDDVYPSDSTMIRLYGEAHGVKEYYDIESELWKGYYDEGYRNLFVELPYYNAEFLNLWMKAEDDEILDRLFEDIQGTQSGNEYYLQFLHGIKEACPETVFWGTDVGHQYDTTGPRYLQYLKDNGLKDSENYALAEECILQGKAFYKNTSNNTGISPIREKFMILNFIDAYERCGGGKVMGIYGGYHTDLSNPEVMGGSLREEYGDSISSVRLSSLATEQKPYQFGFCLTGLIFLVMLFVPNIIWGKRPKPEGYEESAKRENKVLLSLERAGEVLVTATLLLLGLYFDMRIWFWIMAFVLMILYEFYWIRYFRSEGTMKDFYSSFAGFPVAGATLPVIAVLLLGIYSRNYIMIAAGIILGIGHIGIHLQHRREVYK